MGGQYRVVSAAGMRTCGARAVVGEMRQYGVMVDTMPITTAAAAAAAAASTAITAPAGISKAMVDTTAKTEASAAAAAVRISYPLSTVSQ